MKEMFKFIEPAYKNYSIYVANRRALPNLIDGLKTGQKKILYTSLKNAKSFINVAALSGYTKAEANYHHGDTSLNDAISLMAQDFTGSNNYPLFHGEGGFGNKFGDRPSQARYIRVKLSEFFYHLFNDKDLPVLEKSYDIDDPEPKYYVPILPLVLLNGVAGIAVGYSTNILSFHPLDVIKNIENILAGKKTRVELRPYYKGYKGKIEKDGDKWVMYGCFEKKGSHTIIITELPIGLRFRKSGDGDDESFENISEKYKNYLNDLCDNGTIKDWDDLCDEDWCYKIKVSKEFLEQKTDQEIIDIFKLKTNLNENLNVIWDEKIITYDSTIKLIEDFVKIRLDYYQKRKDYIIYEKLKDILSLLVKYNINKYLVSQKDKTLDKAEILNYLSMRRGKINDYFKGCLKTNADKLFDIYDSLCEKILANIKLSELYNDKLQAIQDHIAEVTKECNEMFDSSVEQLYTEELNEIKKYLKKIDGGLNE